MLTVEKHYFWIHSKINFYVPKFSALRVFWDIFSVFCNSGTFQDEECCLLLEGSNIFGCLYHSWEHISGSYYRIRTWKHKLFINILYFSFSVSKVLSWPLLTLISFELSAFVFCHPKLTSLYLLQTRFHLPFALPLLIYLFYFCSGTLSF